VRGYVLKSESSDDLVNTIHEVVRGAIHLSTAIPQGAFEGNGASGRPTGDSLTERERQVLQMIAEGKSSRSISETLGLSIKTVESHRSRIMHKLKIHRAAELIRYAVRHRLVRA